MGMARTFVAASRGLDAVGVNPANLALREEGTVSFSLFPLAVHLGSDFLDYDIYTSYFTGVETDSGRVPVYLTEEDERRILDAFDADVALTTTDLEARLFGASLRLRDVGAFAFTVDERISALANLPKDYLEFAFSGNPPGSDYNFSGTEVKMTWAREFALSFATQIPGIKFLQFMSGGVAVKYLQGYGYFEVQRFNTRLVTDNNGTLAGDVDFLSRRAGVDPLQNRYLNRYKLFPAPAGTGFAFDIGVAGAVNDFLFVGTGVTDIGWMRWSRGTQEQFIDSTFVVDDALDEQQRRRVEEALRGKKRPAGPFTTPLATTLRLGFAVDVHKVPEFESFPGELLVALDYNQGLHLEPGSTVTPRVSLGTEYKPVRWLPLRTGISFGGTDQVNVAFGLGLQFSVFTFDIGSENITWLFAPRSFSYGSVAMGMRFRI
jgi:hypothetical protein